MPRDIKNILFTSDLSQGSRYVFDYAINLAISLEANMTILHILEGTSASAGTLQKLLGGFLNPEQLEELKGKHKEAAMTTLTGKSFHFAAIKKGIELASRDVAETMALKGIKTNEVIVSEGDKVEEILRTAKEKDCQLIVVGTHRHGHLTEAFVRSTSHDLLRKGDIPVLAVPIPRAVD